MGKAASCAEGHHLLTGPADVLKSVTPDFTPEAEDILTLYRRACRAGAMLSTRSELE